MQLLKLLEIMSLLFMAIRTLKGCVGGKTGISNDIIMKNQEYVLAEISLLKSIHLLCFRKGRRKCVADTD